MEDKKVSEYQFTKDWFNWAPEVWQQLIPYLPGDAGSREFLEIGSFEGRSAVWIVENMMADGDILGCVDTWEGGEEHGEEDMGSVEERFDHNIAILRTKYPERFIDQYKHKSTVALAEIMQGDHNPTFEFIYIDGSHIAKDVLTDACMAWPLLKPKGLMVFDDYMWGDPRDILHRPKIAIDAFTNIFAEELDIIHVGYQLVVRKKG
jgi:predicted O-methyltransferase YrrM